MSLWKVPACTNICKEVSASALFNRCCKNTHFFFSYTKIVVKGMTRAEHILKVMYKLIAEMLIAQSQLIYTKQQVNCIQYTNLWHVIRFLGIFNSLLTVIEKYTKHIDYILFMCKLGHFCLSVN